MHIDERVKCTKPELPTYASVADLPYSYSLTTEDKKNLLLKKKGQNKKECQQVFLFLQ